MAPTEYPPPEPAKILPGTRPGTAVNLFKADLILRLLVFATTLAATVLMVTSHQSVLIKLPFSPIPLAIDAKFNYSPAFIYFVAALSVACFYSLLTGVAAAVSISKPSPATKLLLHLAFLDTLMFGVVASATGAAAGVAYIGLKGDSHVGWNKVCNIYGKYCRHVGSSVFLSLVASIILLLLVMVSTFSLYHRSRDLRY